MQSQCLDEDAHNTSLTDMWMSCETFPNPLGALGNNHWIMYEFDQAQGISDIKIWNINHPDHLEAGIKTLRIDYSPDGANWSELGIVELEKAEASADYLGIDLELGEFEARYVLLTSLENYGSSCTGIAEVRFNLAAVSTATEESLLSTLIEVSPNPADDQINVVLQDIATEDIAYTLVDMTGKIILREKTDKRSIQDGFSIDASNLAEGHYSLQLTTDIGAATKQVIIIHAK